MDRRVTATHLEGVSGDYYCDAAGSTSRSQYMSPRRSGKHGRELLIFVKAFGRVVSG
jgi:hypothetical protein